LERWEPVLNYTFRDLPLIDTPGSARWSGELIAPKTGVYEFLIVTFENAKAGLSLDGSPVTDLAAHPAGRAKLKAGNHKIFLDYQMPAAQVAAVNLLWKKPGAEKFEFVPNENFGKIPRAK
jgi:hypothetical protein